MIQMRNLDIRILDPSFFDKDEKFNIRRLKFGKNYFNKNGHCGQSRKKRLFGTQFETRLDKKYLYDMHMDDPYHACYIFHNGETFKVAMISLKGYDITELDDEICQYVNEGLSWDEIFEVLVL